MSNIPGSIRSEEAYALGKMLDHSSWHGLLVRGITPSDVDFPHIPFGFDNRGSGILCELTSETCNWGAESNGQRKFYEAFIRYAPHCAVLCKHSVKPELGRKIDTLHDIEQFQVMVWDFGPVLSEIFSGERWQHFVIRWVNDPDGPMKIRRQVIGSSIGMIKPAKGLPPAEG